MTSSLIGVLSHKDLESLAKHEYSCSGKSILEAYLQPFWEWLVLQMPKTLAPNLITLIGLIVNVVTSFCLFYYNPTAATGVVVPPAVYAMVGIGLFAYQALDAIDGKQARRTNSASPLGELFDHGCDAISTIFLLLGIGVSLQIGATSLMLVGAVCANTTFYSAHWKTYVTGKMQFGKFDVTEAQLLFIGIHLGTAIFGADMWATSIIGDYEIKHILVLSAMCASVYTIVVNINGVLAGGPGPEGTTIAQTSVLSPMIPLLLYFWATHVIYDEVIFKKMPILFLLVTGLYFVKITFRLIVAHMCKAKLMQVDNMVLQPLLFVFNWKLGLGIDWELLLYVCAGWSLWNCGYYAVKVCSEICTHLKIRVFSIKPPKEE